MRAWVHTTTLAVVGGVFTLAAAATVVVLVGGERRARQRKGSFTERYVNLLGTHKDHRKSNDNPKGDDGDVCEARVKVIYGSESGNAETLAKGFVMELIDRGVSATLIDSSNWAYLDEYMCQNTNHAPLLSDLSVAPAEGKESVIPNTEKNIYIFIVSTTGEGEPPANFMTLMQEMQLTVQAHTTAAAAAKENRNVIVEPPPFSNLCFAVFAVGDSSYKYYCKCGTTTHQLLKKGGGTDLYQIGFGDARNPAAEDVFDEWQERVMESMERMCGIKMVLGGVLPPDPQLRFIMPDRPADALPFHPPASLLEPSLNKPILVQFSGKERLMEPREDGSAVYRFTFSIAQTNIKYQAGDHFGIYPANPSVVVERCRRVLNISDSVWKAPVELCTTVNARARATYRNVLPARVPLGVALERYIDLCGKPKKTALRILARYCSKEEKEAFLNLLRPIQNAATEEGHSSGTTNQATTEAIPNSQCRTVLDYMEAFPSCCCIPIGHFMEVMPRIQPRYYSIASDMLTHPTSIELFVRVVKDGLASQYLCREVPIGGSVFAFVRVSTFHIPTKMSERPLLMIGPGTGAAAMIGFCFRREALMRTRPSQKYGPLVFLFGSQSRTKDYFVEEYVTRWSMEPRMMLEWDEGHPHAAAGAAARAIPTESPLAGAVISFLDCAFSRDQAEKIYVSYLLQKHKEFIYTLLMSNEGGGCMLYVSGDAKNMAKDVDKALVSILQDLGGMSRLAALDFLRRMEHERRFLKDVY